METLAGGVPEVGQATTPPVERCPARFHLVRDEYLAACRRRGNAEASVVTKQRAAEQFLAYLLTPELPLPDWTADQDLLQWLDHACR